MARLTERTEAFHRDCKHRTPEELERFKARYLERETPQKLLELLRNCPFLGWIDEANTLVGCLLHPALNGGEDYRDYGVYDAQICERYLCAAYSGLNPEERRLLVTACGSNSVLYGLALNDRSYLRGLFLMVADLTGHYPKGRRVFAPDFVAAVGRFLELKLSWPFRDPESGIIGAYLPDGAEEVVLRRINYAELGVEESQYDRFLCALGSSFDELEELQEAEAILCAAVHEVVESWTKVIG